MGARKEKEAFVDTLSAEFGKSKGVYLAECQGINANVINSFRKKCRESKVRYMIAKNTLARIAFNKVGIAKLDADLKGPTSILIAYEDGTAPAKIITDFLKVKENQDKFKVKGCVVEGVSYTARDVEKLATVPSREVLYAQLAGLLSAPMQKLAGVIQGIIRQVPTVIDAVAKKKAAEAK